MDKKYYLLKLVGPRVTFPMDITETEKELMQQHTVYWKELFQKEIVVYGPVFDPKGAWGLGVVELENEESVRGLANNDPVIKGNAGFSYEMYPMQVGMARR